MRDKIVWSTTLELIAFFDIVRLNKWKSGNMARFAIEFPDFYLEISIELSR